jgi:hypothetical protein
MIRGSDSYLKTCGTSLMRPLATSSIEGIEQAVVIPALSETDSLFQTLASLAANPQSDLEKTIVICVVNNHRPPIAGDEDIKDNQKALSILQSMVSGRSAPLNLATGMLANLDQIARSRLRLGVIDASSPGVEIPDRDGGVGTARKIGMDEALRVIRSNAAHGGLIGSLDADTLVDENYLPAVEGCFKRKEDPAAVTAYAHQKPDDLVLLAGICCYEIFLRAYVIGLSYAGSPYAFHSIGSTMVCTVQGYRDVRGMNRREAAEDFHFLNKIAKIGDIGVISETTVFPSFRPSPRVPFGTGQRMIRFLNGKEDEYRIYDPRIFRILREWIDTMRENPDRNPETILVEARRIHESLWEYLRLSRFEEDWATIRKNARSIGHLQRQFRTWFDGLKTLRLVHHLSRTSFPLAPMFDALLELTSLAGSPLSTIEALGDTSAPEAQFRILEALRSQFSQS